jgi:hypothetical protein
MATKRTVKKRPASTTVTKKKGLPPGLAAYMANKKKKP